LEKNTIDVNCEFNLVIKKLNKLDKKILIVLNKKKEVIGSITDGDIRRFFLRKKKKNIFNLMNKAPLIIKETQPTLITKKLEKKYKFAPLVNASNKFIKLIILKSHFDIKSIAVFILAGGKGLRLRPLTKNLPKPLIKIGNMSLLEKILSSLFNENFDDINISVNYLHNKIINSLNPYLLKNKLIKIIKEKNFLGTMGSLRLLNTNKKTILIINSDIYTNLNFKNVIQHHFDTGSDITISVKERLNKIPYGVIKTNKNKIISFNEKPLEKFLYNAGIYVINKNIIQLVPKNKKFDAPELIKKAINKKKKITPFYIYENWIDVGSKETLIKLDKSYKRYFKNHN
jgi:dTDP-glucose pyrophosphorylase